MGEEVLRAAIEELEFFGVPEEMVKKQQAPLKKVVFGALEEELKIAQLRALSALLKSDLKPDEMKKQIIEKLNDFNHDIIPNILASILAAEETRDCID